MKSTFASLIFFAGSSHAIG